ncbi:hypothetical protein EDC01DRAFT_244410 [Geopyxis carbonaria]|nr:hypothetical protein EDC01DRAFT_244410 [Geopyxis carbonaria]
MSSYEISNKRLDLLHRITMTDQSPIVWTQPEQHAKAVPLSLNTFSNKTKNCRSNCKPKSKFRFKTKSKSSTLQNSNHHWNSSKKKRKECESVDCDSLKHIHDDSSNSTSFYENADPDTAFQESILDAIADDEGAAFWEGVYGHRIHDCGWPPVLNKESSSEQIGKSSLEFANHVGEKLWERSYEHILEERTRRKNEKETQKRIVADKKLLSEQKKSQRRRIIRRRNHQLVQDRWVQYGKNWNRQLETGDVRNIPWPVHSGDIQDINKQSVEEFILTARCGGDDQFLDTIKLERIRWHPDKAQQRWGNEGLSDEQMKAITTVFQTIDKLWLKYKQNVD